MASVTKAIEWKDRWRGATVVCIASGPSLTPEDCEAVRASGHRTIVVNTSFLLAPWADVLLAFDAKWWEETKRGPHSKALSEFAGEKLCLSPLGVKHGATLAHPGIRHGNSGASAIGLAMVAGAKRVILLGYDCQRSQGKTHWHGDHPKALGNARSLPSWPKQFDKLAKLTGRAGMEVINCTRETALTCFPLKDLSQALG